MADQHAGPARRLLSWHIGQRIRPDIIKKKPAYGDEILQTLSAKLTLEFGRGISVRNLASMVRFAEMFPHARIVSALQRQLSWIHFTQIIYLDDPRKRDFYTEMGCIREWSTRTATRPRGVKRRSRGGAGTKSSP